MEEPNRVLFFTEVDGHEEDIALKSAFTELKERACYFKVIGSFAI